MAFPRLMIVLVIALAVIGVVRACARPSGPSIYPSGGCKRSASCISLHGNLDPGKLGCCQFAATAPHSRQPCDCQVTDFPRAIGFQQQGKMLQGNTYRQAFTGFLAPDNYREDYYVLLESSSTKDLHVNSISVSIACMDANCKPGQDHFSLYATYRFQDFPAACIYSAYQVFNRTATNMWIPSFPGAWGGSLKLSITTASGCVPGAGCSGSGNIWSVVVSLGYTTDWTPPPPS